MVFSGLQATLNTGFDIMCSGLQEPFSICKYVAKKIGIRMH